MHTRGAGVLMFCYNVGICLDRVEEDLRKHSRPGVSLLIVGCHKDHGCDADTERRAEALAQVNGAKLLLVSNMTGEGISALLDELAAACDSYYLRLVNTKSSGGSMSEHATRFPQLDMFKATPSAELLHTIVDGLGLAQIEESTIALPYSTLAERALQAGPAKYKRFIWWHACHAALLPPFLYVYTSASDSHPELTARMTTKKAQ